MYSTGEDTKTLENAGRIAPKHDSYAELEMEGDPYSEANLARREREGHFPRVVETEQPERTYHMRVETATGSRTEIIVKPARTCYTVRCLGCDRVYPVDMEFLTTALSVVQEWDCPNKEEK